MGLQNRCRYDHNRYFVKWRGYPESYNSWEFEMRFGRIAHTPLTFLNATVRVNLRSLTLGFMQGTKGFPAHLETLVEAGENLH